MPKTWNLHEIVPPELCDKFSQYSTLAVQLLYNRGLVDESSIEAFLAPKYEHLHSPFLFQDMEKSVERVWQAVDNKECICIYGDYDADAVTANAVLQQAFRYLGVEVQSYIPDRFTEGYGLNLDAFAKIKSDGCTLVITVDCGTNSVDVADWCRENGIDLLITDHHEIIGELPKAFALVNPKNPIDTYPYHEITGVGVAFKLAAAVLSREDKVRACREVQGKEHTPGWEKWLLDLVAIGTVADCHSLMGENRILVKFGLQVLAKSKWAGLRAICRTAGLDFIQKLPDTYTLGFVIAPRLNAAGRLEHANIALHVILEQDPVLAQQRSFELEAINKRRQDLTEQVVSEAREQAEQMGDRDFLVLWGDGWPKGIVGLVAGKIAEEFGKPTIVLERGESESTGSARTVGDFSVIEALKYASEHLSRFGGHQQAAGLTLKTGEYEAFYRKLLEYAERNIGEGDLERRLELEAQLSPSDINLETLRLQSLLEPFGVGNPKPRFLIEGLSLASMRTVGAAAQHLQAQFKAGALIVSSIGFGLSHFAKTYKVGDTVDVAAELLEDAWNGHRGVKLRIIDIRKR